MTKLFFNRQNDLKNLIPMGLAILLLVLKLIDISNIIGSAWNTRLMSIGFLILAFILGKTMVFRNYFGWSNRDLTIRINSFSGTNIKFNKIKETILEKKTLTLKSFDGTQDLFNLSDVVEDDIERIRKILLKYTVTNNG
jgi:hypothetical protein